MAIVDIDAENKLEYLCVCTHSMCMKNVTLSIDDNLLLRSRDYAKRNGTTLNELVRGLLRKNVNINTAAGKGEALLTCIEQATGDTKEWKWNREDLYDR